jgi:hypothetical protein
MNSMYATGSVLPFAFLWGIHVLSVIAFFTGFLFLIFWSYKHLSGAQLKKWGWTLVIAGSLACLMTIASMGHTWAGMGKMKMSSMGGHMMSNGMMDDDDMGMMSMKGMTMMLEGKTGDDFDKAFLTMMIPHHQGAIDMAKLAQKNAKHAEIKAMADDIIVAQQREIDQMNGWLKSWGYNK